MMTAYHFLLLVTLYLLKPVRDSLFLSERGALELPFVFMLTTVAVIPVAALHVRAGRRVRLSRLVNAVAVILILNLLGLRWLVQLDSAWVYYLLYAWVSVYAVLVTSQFWLLANAVFTAAESKRIFPLLSAGAIMGAVFGGEITGLLVDRWGMRTENLLLVCAGLLAVSSFIVVWVRRKSAGREGPEVSEASEGPPANLWGVVKTLRTSRHLQLIIGVIALAVITTTFVDYQFKTVAAQAFPDEGALTTFIGRFYGRVSLIAFLFQIFLAPRLIRVLGVGGALSFLPLTLALGSVGMLLYGGLWAGTALRGIDQSLKHSIDKTGRELLFVPVDLEKKKRVKVFIDLFFDQGMQGVGGFLLLFLTLVVELTVSELSMVVLGLLAVWVGFVLLARSSYINQFRDLLQQEEEDGKDTEEPSVARPAMSFEEVRRSLWSRSGSEVLRGLERLEEASDGTSAPAGTLPVEALRELLDHRMAEVRRRVIRLLRERDVKGVAEAIAVHLEDAAPEVRLEAARYLYRNFEGGRDMILKQGLEHDDLRIRAAAVGLIAKDGGPEEQALLTKPLLQELLSYDGEAAEEARIEVARALSVVDWPERDALLIELMDDPSPEVATRAVKSAGQAGDRAFVAPLLARLTGSGHEKEVRRSLASFGTRILGTLYDYLVDEQVDEGLRRRIPAVLAAERSQAAVDVLLMSRGRVTVPVWHEVVRALSRLRQQSEKNANEEGSSLHFPEGPVREAVQAETARYAGLGQVLHVRQHTTAAAARALEEARLHKARRRSLERLCRLLGLRHRQDDLHSAYRGLVSEDAALRSSALELMDNVLKWDIKRDLLPLLDDPDARHAARQAPGLFDLPELSDWDDVLLYLLDSRDPALAASALEGVDEPPAPALRERLEAAAHGPHEQVRAAARAALGRSEKAEAEAASSARSSEEKASQEEVSQEKASERPVSSVT